MCKKMTNITSDAFLSHLQTLRRDDVFSADCTNSCLKVVCAQILLFPILVVLFAAVAFLAGGKCAAWQWWTAFVLTAGVPFFRLKWKNAAICGLVLMLITLGCVFVGIVTIDPSWVDNDAYHLPGTRMLADGWNPVESATPEKIGSAMKLDPWNMRVWHILSVHKSVWIFNAVSGLVHGEPFSITHSAGYWIFAVFALFVFINFRWAWIFKILFISLTYRYAFNISTVVDTVVGIAGVLLLITMYKSVVERKYPWLYLLGFSFWMITAKASGALACFAMWFIFSLFIFFRSSDHRSRCLLRLACSAAVLTVCFCVVCASPYLSAWREYKHPLYPAMTVDEKNYPAVSITGDLIHGNADFSKMGAIGSFANAYISPSLTRRYYNWILGRKDFMPMNRSWYVLAADEGEPTASCPTTSRERTLLWVSVILLCLCLKFGFIPAALLFAMAFVPHQYYGYLRYFPWVAGIEILALVLGIVSLKEILCYFFPSKISDRLAFAFVCICCFYTWAYILLQTSFGINEKISCLREDKPRDVYVNVYGTLGCCMRKIPEELVAHYLNGGGDPERVAINSLRLLMRKTDFLAAIRVHGVPQERLLTMHKRPFGYFVQNRLQLEMNVNRYEGTCFQRYFIRYPSLVCKMMTWGIYKLVRGRLEHSLRRPYA